MTKTGLRKKKLWRREEYIASQMANSSSIRKFTPSWHSNHVDRNLSFGYILAQNWLHSQAGSPMWWQNHHSKSHTSILPDPQTQR